MKYLFLDGSCGISGDMTVAALLDLGASQEKLEQAVASLGLEGVHTHLDKSNSYSMAGLSFDVHVHTPHGEESADHVHVHEEEYVEHHHEHSGKDHHEHKEHCESHCHSGHEHSHSHEHGTEHHHHDEGGHGAEHHHVHRHLSDVFEILERGATAGEKPAAISPAAMTLAKKIFEVIAQAESKAHGVPVEQVHFHEVGAIDSIIDIMAVAVLFDDIKERFDIDGVVVTGLNEGSGFVKTQHGMLPIPVPAVAHIAETAGIALHITDTAGEMVTPTGAGIVATLRTTEALPESYKILKSGVGLGKRDFGRANFLRAQIIEDVSKASSSENSAGENHGNSPADTHVYILECNIDDNTAEELGFAMDQILAAGARDVHFMPCQMKKNRPGVLLRAIADSAHLKAVEHSILKNTSTVGLRRIPVERTCMSRSFFEVETKYGTIKVKKSILESTAENLETIEKCKPEFDDIKAAAEKSGVTFQEVLRQVELQIKQQY